MGIALSDTWDSGFSAPMGIMKVGFVVQEGL